MKKMLGIILALSMLAIFAGITPLTAGATTTGSLITGSASTIEGVTTVPTGWSMFSAGTLSVSSTVANGGSNSLAATARTGKYCSPAYKIHQMFKDNGVGTYNFSIWVYADGLLTATNGLSLKIRCNATAPAYTFVPSGTSVNLTNKTISNVTWTEITGTVIVEQSDIDATLDTGMVLCLDGVDAAATLYVDDLTVERVAPPTAAPATATAAPATATAAPSTATAAPATATAVPSTATAAPIATATADIHQATVAPEASASAGGTGGEKTGDYLSAGYVGLLLSGLVALTIGVRRYKVSHVLK